MSKYIPVLLWILVGVVVASTFFVLSDHFGNVDRSDVLPASPPTDDYERDVAARVGPYSLYSSDLSLINAGSGAVEAWVNDQLLACAAEDAGLENPAISRFVQGRARQLYLRDLMIDRVLDSVTYPTQAETRGYMTANPALFLLERHYYQIIVADSATAESLHTRLGWGQNFQVTAQNISIGQKAAIGGDLGFTTGGEMLTHGLPEEVALLDGLSEVIPSSIGWHIFKVSETRALTDSLRAERAAAEQLYYSRLQAAIDSVRQATRNRLSVEVNN